MNKYDIIGDIHGYGEELKSLLEKLGYKKNDEGIYQPPEEGRKAVFTGDYIDRGKENFEVIDIVRKMVDAGYAHAIMGNHDLNAAMYHTRLPDEDGQLKPMRANDDKNKKQHATFLDELNRSPREGASNIMWLKSLPVWLELDGMHFVHAQWHKPSMEILKKSGVLDDENRIKPDQWAKLAGGDDDDKATDEHKAIAMLTKGTEIDVGMGGFRDPDGHLRDKARLKWWANPDDPNLTLAQVLLDVPPEAVEGKKLLPETRELMRELQNTEGNTIFFGHYWQKGEFPTIETKNAICIDQSVAKDGHLAAATVTVEKGKIQDMTFTSVKSRPPHKPDIQSVVR